ncbi:MAG TPA: hypothetical protein VF278_02515, partial [Pirellulales bacterium]
MALPFVAGYNRANRTWRHRHVHFLAMMNLAQTNRAKARTVARWRPAWIAIAATAVAAGGGWSIRDLLWPAAHTQLVVER